MYKISIIIPITKTKYKRDAIDSLLNQTIGFENLQIIYVNSQNTQNPKIIDEYSKKYNNIILISTTNDIPTHLFDLGIKYAAADYLMFLNPSDILNKNSCELFYDKISENEYDVIMGVDSDGKFENKLKLLFQDLTISNKIFKKSFIIKENMNITEEETQSDSIFVLNTILNSDKVDIIINPLLKRHSIKNKEVDEEYLRDYLDKLNEMLYICFSKNKQDLFIKYLLNKKLTDFTNLLSKSNLHTSPLLRILKSSKPLCTLSFKHDQEGNPLLHHIASGNYEKALQYIYDKPIQKQDEIKIAALCNSITHNSFKFECNLISLNKFNCLNKLKSDKPHFFLVTSSFYNYPEEKDAKELNEILTYCRGNNIPTVFLEDENINDNIILKEAMINFDYIFTNYKRNIINYQDEYDVNIYYIEYACQPRLFNPYCKNSTMFNEVKNNNLNDILENHNCENKLKQILDILKLKYVPNLKHVTVFYKLDKINKLNDIYSHFFSIDYPYKHIKIIADETKQCLPNTILESELNEISLKDEDYFCFANLNLNSNFIKEALLHFKYIDNNIGIKKDNDEKFQFDKVSNVENVIFNSTNFKKAISNDENSFDVYLINDSEIKVSIIIPVFNVEKYLRECLDSVINQTLENIEIICINDESNDSSLEILKEYANNDSRFKIVSQFNSGPGGARNTGLDIVQGKYIYFIDSDDIIKPNGLEEMYRECELKNLDMLKFNLMTFEDSTYKEKELYQRVKPAFLKELGDVIFNYKDIGLDVYTLSPNMQSTFFKREPIKDLRFPEKIIFEDNIFLIEALFNSKRIYYLDKFLASKRERKSSITQSTGRDFSDIVEIRNMIVDLAKKYNHYEDYKFTIYSRKYMFIRLLFLQTKEYYKKRFFEKVKTDCINKKEEYENEGIFDILDKKSINTFNAGLYSKDYIEFEELIRKA